MTASISFCVYIFSCILCSIKEIHMWAVSDKDVACYFKALWEFHLHFSDWVLLPLGKSKLQGHFHLTNLMHYGPLWVFRKKQAISRCFLASLKHCRVIPETVSAGFFHCVKACHLSPTKRGVRINSRLPDKSWNRKNTEVQTTFMWLWCVWIKCFSVRNICVSTKSLLRILYFSVASSHLSFCIILEITKTFNL